MLYTATLRLKISNYYVRHLLRIPKGFNADFYDWTLTLDECTATFWCSDDNANPIERKTKEQLNDMIVSKFGNNIISDYMKMPSISKDTKWALLSIIPSLRLILQKSMMILKMSMISK